MKKRFRAITAAVLAVAMVVPMVPGFAQETDAEYVLNETFNSVPTGAVEIDGITISGGKAKVVEDSKTNKSLYCKSDAGVTVSAKAVNYEDNYVVYSVDIKAGTEPVNMKIGTSEAQGGTISNLFFTISNNAVILNDGRNVGGVNNSGFTTLSAVLKKGMLCDYYLNNKLVINDVEAQGNAGNFLTITGNTCYIDNIRSYAGDSLDKSLQVASVTSDYVEVVNQDDAAGDFMFFDNRICKIYATGPVYHGNVTFAPKTNSITKKRLENYQSIDRENYIYFERTTNDDCFMDIYTRDSRWWDRRRSFVYYKIEGDFRINKFGANIVLPMLRELDESNAAKYTDNTCVIRPDGSLQFTDGTATAGVFKSGETVHLMFFIDMANHKLDVYKRNEETQEMVKIAAGKPINSNMTKLDMISVRMNQGAPNDLWLDNFEFVGITEPIVDGVDTMTSLYPEPDGVEDFLKNKSAVHAYGNIYYKDGQKKQMTEKGIYDEDAEQYYVPASTLKDVFGLEISEENGSITGTANISADGKVTYNGKTVTLDPKPKTVDGKLYVPIKQFATDVVGKHIWWHETGLLLFADREIRLDIGDWEYISTRSNVKNWNDMDHLNNYMQYVRPDADRIIADYVELSGDEALTQHPRLFLNESDFEKLRQTYECDCDEVYTAIVNELIKDADAYLKEGVQGWEWSDFMRMGDACMIPLSSRMATLSLIYRLTGDKKYLNGIIEQFEECAKWPGFSIEHIIDNGEALVGIAMAFDWCYNDFTEEQRQLAKTVLYDKAFKPMAAGLYGRLPNGAYGNSLESGFLTSDNFNSILNGGIIAAAIATMEYDTEKTMDYLKNAIRSLEFSMMMLTPDGGWNESPGYWSFAMKTMFPAVAALEKAFGSSYNLMDGKGVINTVNYFVSTIGIYGTNNYGDDDLRTNYSDRSFFYLGKRYNAPEAVYMRRYDLMDNIERTLWFDGVFYSPESKDLTGESLANLPKMSVTKGTEIVTFRDSYDRDTAQTYFSAHFGTTSGYHQHPDCGAFVLDLLGERWASDLGKEDYLLMNEGHVEGWDLHRQRAEGHNMLVLNEQNYKTTTELKTGQFAPIIDAQYNDYGGFVYADMDDVYNEASKMTLGYYLDDNMNSVTYRNEFTVSEETDCLWSINTYGDIAISGNTAFLSQNGKSVKVEFITNGKDAKWEDRGHPGPSAVSPQQPLQSENKDFNKLALTYKAPAGDNKLIIKISPMGMNIKPIADVAIKDWKLPEKSDLNAVDLSFKMLVSGATVNGAVPVYDGVMPEVKVIPNDPTCIVEINQAKNVDEKTVVKVWNKEKTMYSVGILSYYGVNTEYIGDYKTLPILSVEVSSTPEPVNRKDNMLDSNFTTRWTCMAYGEYGIFDLGKSQTIDGVAVAFWKGAERAYKFDIYVSNDGENWTEVLKGATSPKISEDYETYAFANSVNARFVKFVGQGSSVDNAAKFNTNVLEFRALKKN